MSEKKVLYKSYSAHFRALFGERVQKVTINGGFTCPNRDGSVGTGGCSFCLNEAFNPSYCNPQKSITQQINEGIEFHTRRYAKATKYLAYFQAFSNTYKPLEELKSLYEEALAHPGVIGLIIGTRPDCVDDEKLDYFAELSKRCYLAIEYGVESVHDKTLLEINRGHTFEVARKAIEATHQRGIKVGGHFILGLPGESREMLVEQTSMINSLPLDTIKFHQLQLFKGTPMAQEYLEKPEKFHFYSLEEYIELFADILERLRDDLIVERFAGEAPPRYHAGHPWGLVRNERLWQLLEKELLRRDTHQGCLLQQ